MSDPISLVDNYINKAEPFAQPILQHLRNIVHTACPGVKETIKWSFPNFEYKGSILCHMASFKNHCSFGFWLGSQLSDPNNIIQTGSEKTSMGSLGQIKSVNDLPSPEILIAYIHEAMTLTDSGAKIKREKVITPRDVETPSWFLEALKQNNAAIIAFEKFSLSQKREYVNWLTEAKTDATRLKRMTTAVEWIAEGKIRNWKYLKC